MQDVQLKLFQRCLRDLNTLGCTFAILDAEGNKHGTLEVVDESRKKSRCEFEFGVITKYIEPFIQEMGIGDVVEIPINEYGHSRIQSTAGSWFFKRHGASSHTSTYNKEKNVLEFMRLA